MEPEKITTDWLRNQNTLEFLGIWESIYNPLFNYGEFTTIKSKAGLNNFKISVKEFVSLPLNSVCGLAPNSKFILSRNTND